MNTDSNDIDLPLVSGKNSKRESRRERATTKLNMAEIKETEADEHYDREITQGPKIGMDAVSDQDNKSMNFTV